MYTQLPLLRCWLTFFFQNRLTVGFPYMSFALPVCCVVTRFLLNTWLQASKFHLHFLSVSLHYWHRIHLCRYALACLLLPLCSNVLAKTFPQYCLPVHPRQNHRQHLFLCEVSTTTPFGGQLSGILPPSLSWVHYFTVVGWTMGVCVALIHFSLLVVVIIWHPRRWDPCFLSLSPSISLLPIVSLLMFAALPPQYH